MKISITELKETMNKNNKKRRFIIKFGPEWIFKDFKILTKDNIAFLKNNKYVCNAGTLIFNKEGRFFLLGEHSETGDLTHFAGGIKGTKETIFEGVYRELEEEACESFKLKEKIEDCPGVMVYSNKAKFCYIVFFCECIETDIEEIKSRFVENVKCHNMEEEITSIQKITVDEFEKLINITGRIESRGNNFSKFKIYEVLRKIIRFSPRKELIKELFNNEVLTSSVMA